ncbi:unnamed protein product, partial [Adineta ricciae]
MSLENSTNSNDIQYKVRRLWCSLLHLDSVPTDDSITWFALGGSSLTLMELFSRYQFDLSPHRQLNRSDFLTQPTIIQHVRLLTTNNAALNHADQSKVNNSASQIVFIVTPGSSLSLQRLNCALTLLIRKHPTLRIRLHQSDVSFDDMDNVSFVQISKVESENEEMLQTHFNLICDRVFQCHAIRRTNGEDEDLLTGGDMLLLNFHYAIFDYFIESIFLADFKEAYSTLTLDMNDNHTPIYIDYTLYERDDRDDSMLSESDLGHQLQLPYDHCPLTSARTGRASTVNLELDGGESLANFACQLQTTLSQVYLSAYYVFLYKLTQCQDLTIDSYVNDGSQYETACTTIMIESEKPFIHLIEHIKTMAKNMKSLPYMTNGFRFQTITSKIELGDKYELTRCIRPPNTTKYDLCLSIVMNEREQMTGSFVYARDLFDESTIITMARRFESLLGQLLCSSLTSSIFEFSLLLPNETQILHQLANSSEQVSLHKNLLPIHQRFAYQTEEHPQKLAVVFDDQSLTYAELLHSSQLLAHHLKENCHVQPGDIIAQCVERSIEMVIGILSILMSGASYCPLSPDQPSARLQSMIEQVRAKCVLCHNRTCKFISSNNINIDQILTLLTSTGWIDNDDDTNVYINSIAYVIFTSGSTGTPKAVPISHQNFAACVDALAYSAIMARNDTVLQITPPTFDIHIQEILGTLWLGGSICLLRPTGNLDMNYLTSTVQRHEISFAVTVPTLLAILAQHVHDCPDRRQTLFSLKRLCSIGELLRPQTATQLYNCLNSTALIYHLYGPTECIFAATFHLITKDDLEQNSLPIGRPLAGYTCHVLDRYFQPVLCDKQVGQLFIGGQAVFRGYLNRADLTHEALVSLPQEQGVLYRTGDLVRVDTRTGRLYFSGRTDFQVKLRGQRIELGEIEATIMRFTPEISNCVVIKREHDNLEHLVAYVQTKVSMNISLLRETCRERLPLYMVPSLFILIDHFPLNPNGKLDRKALPPPDFSLLLSFNSNALDEQHHTDIEQQISSIWSQVLHLESISSTSVSFFALGGNSLLLMKLQHVYQTEFHQTVDISKLFRHATIHDHAQLLEDHQMIIEPHWHSFNITRGPASFAQTRLYLDERVRFSSVTNAVATYHIPLVYEIIQTSVSLERLNRALLAVIQKHKALRTCLTFDENAGVLQQEVLDQVQVEVILTLAETDVDVKKIIYDEETNSRLFDLSKARVFRCHAIRRLSTIDNDLLQPSDLLVFNFHHAAFDGGSIDVFFQDLKKVYSTDQSLSSSRLDYIDYAIHEKERNMDEAKAFWKQQLDGFSNYYLQLPYDCPRTDKSLSGRGITITLQLSNDVVDSMLELMKTHETTLFQLGLAAFYTFLSKLTQEDDLCVLTVIANRTRAELENLIGVFVNTLPYRLIIDPYSSFTLLMQRVKDLALLTLPHTHLPFQEIATNTNIASLQTLFDVETIRDGEVGLDSQTFLRPFIGSTTDPYSVAKFDLTCTLYYNVRKKSLTLSLNGPSDLFEISTIELMAHRYACLLEQLLLSSATKSISEYSLLLPHETQLIDGLDSRNQLLLPSTLLPIHEQFACRVVQHPQKLAVILDDQSLTYAELFHSSQLLARHLIDHCQVERGDIVGQCVERSIEMAIGMMAILFSGASYLPLSPHEPFERLQLLTDLTRPRCVLAHSTTDHLIPKNKVSVENIVKGDFESSTDVNVLMDDIAFLIFTSGSTGTPKVVPISHRNFAHMVQSYCQLQFHDEHYTIIQMASCSFDEHTNEYMGGLICGATIVLLRPHGNLDTLYLCETIERNQATRIDFVPTTVAILGEYLNKQIEFDKSNHLATVKMITVGGEQLQGKVVKTIFRHLQPTCVLANIYAPAESTVSALYYKIESHDTDLPEIIPIGRCLPGRKVLVLDNYGKQVLPDGQNIGEIFLGGVGIFSGYLNDPQASERVLVQLPNVDGVFYRTGDLARITSDGQLVFVGRKDFQVKLRGQRIELGEIETVIMRSSSDITNCVVIKLDHDQIEHLVAYVQTEVHFNVNILRDECMKHLPLYMVPSLFVLIDHFPLNPNGKVDRKALPSPDFTLLASSGSLMGEGEEPRSEMEQQVSSIWSQVLHLESTPSINMSFFKLGGNSLLLMKLHHTYQTQFHQSINVSDLFRRATIHDHAQLLEVSEINTHPTWHSLQVTKGPASFAQTRLYLDERVRFGNTTDKVATYHVPLIYEIVEIPLSVKKLKGALCAVMDKHKALRTRLVFDETKSKLDQQIVDQVALEMVITSVDNGKALEKILYDEETNPALFSVSEGRMFRCHVIRRSVTIDEDLLNPSDIIIFNFHHAAFDGTSIDIFFHDLKEAYFTGNSLSPNLFNYVDYSIHEKEMNMDEARSYWKHRLNEFANTLLSLPYDRFPKDKDTRSGRGLTVSLELSREVIDGMRICMSKQDMTLFQVGLAAFYIFLFKLTQETDLCVLTISANRFRAELNDIIGFFSNTLPQRIIIDPNVTVVVFFDYIKQMCLESMRHAHFPYQEMDELPGIQTLFLAEPIHQPSDSPDFRLIPLAATQDDYVAKFDLTCSLDYNSRAHTVKLSLNASLDLFDVETVSTMIHRFECLLSQIFTSISSPICELSLLLPHEVELLRMVNTDNKFQYQTYSLCIHEQFASRVDEHPQKLAVVLDDQSLTYAELYSLTQLVAYHLMNVCHIRPNDIVPLCVERSLEMPLGILAILMSGAIYCPLTPNHPQKRFQAIINQTNARYILTHDPTVNKFQSMTINLSSFALYYGSDIIEQPFHTPICSVDQVAYIIFTSGSTGEPKGVQLTHRNLLLTVASYAHSGSLLPTDTAMQITPCSFDAHVPELLGCLFMGGTSILLHPDGNIQLDYLTRLVERHQATYMHSVPSHLTVICEQLEQDNAFERLHTLRSLCSSGEPMNVRSLKNFRDNTRATIFNLYGPAECTDISIYKITQDIKQVIEPTCIGPLSPNLKCRILDQYMQTILPDGHQIGELCVSGPSVFPGYLNRDDLTQRVLVTGLSEQKEKYYKTGDLVRLNTNGFLHYVGRRDFMVKLRGQRIELAEIEQTLSDASPNVSKCVVIKHENSNKGHEYLAAFVQTTDKSIEHILQQKCQERLAPYMVPSVFILLDKLPLSENGKIDRARLPNPDTIIAQAIDQRDKEPMTEIERRISVLWCDILRLDTIPSTSFSLFKLGGNSLLLIKLYYSYQKVIQFDTNSLLISQFFRKPTIVDHAKLLEAHQITTELQWESFHMTKGPASFAQTRLYLDERVRFTGATNAVATYHIPLIYEIVEMPLSLSRLKRALHAIIHKHKTLRTRLVYDESEGVLQQEILPSVPLEVHLTSVDNGKALEKILYDEETNPVLFSVSEGRVFRCHAIRRCLAIDEDLLSPSDIVIFNFHHAAFDGTSIDIFFDDLKKAYSTDESLSPCSFDYIDYSVHEKEVNMDAARVYWKQHLNGFTKPHLQLPYDHRPDESNIRSGRGSTAIFELSPHIVDDMLNYLTNCETTLFQFGLAAFYAFLFKLTQETDLCILTVSANRNRAELENMIGFFVNTIPQRLAIEPQKNFGFLIECVKELVVATMPHAHLPYQDIVAGTTTTALQVLFVVETHHHDRVTLSSDIILRPLVTTTTDPQSVAKFDLTCSLHYDVSARSIQVSFDAASDLFEPATVELMARRFHSLLNHILSSPTSNEICELSLFLPHEIELLQNLNISEQIILSSNIRTIQQKFVHQTCEHPQKLAVILDEQSLTYAELFHSSLLVAHHLHDLVQVQSGDIIGQCVERSIEMIIGILSILMSDASYCPLPADQPSARLRALIEQVQAKCVLTHSRTNTLISSNMVDIEQVLSSSWNKIILIDIKSYSVERIAYLVFTSGSTGKPKVVPITHKNFAVCINALAHSTIMMHDDVVLQTTLPTFDIHMQEILGTLWLGGTLVLLRQNGNLDMHYFTSILQRYQITLLIMVPTLISSLTQYLQNSMSQQHALTSIRRLCSLGEALLPQIASAICTLLDPTAQLYNLYGPAECTLISTFHLLTQDDLKANNVPIGRPLPSYKCKVLDTYSQPVLLEHQIGELLIGGEAVFGGYLNQPDISHGPGIFYRTGDLVRIDGKSGVLHYVGRKDFQVKLRGQRIELGEIETVIMRSSSDITNCVVIKLDHDQIEHLVAYVQ